MRVVLSGGAYQARSLISGAQRCVNLYPEQNPADSDPPVPVTHYPTPGTVELGMPSTVSVVRALYTATNGDLYAVTGNEVAYVNAAWERTVIGQLVGDHRTTVSMVDNGVVLVIVDGTANGWAVDLVTRNFAAINDPAFYGANRAEYQDGYLCFDKPGTAQFYISLYLVTFANLTQGVINAGSTYAAFDPLDIAAKTGSADALATIISIKGEVWLLGSQRGSEIWNNTGAADFTFGRQAGAVIEHGCVARYSVASQDVSVFWLSQDLQGKGIVVRGSGYQLERISTHAIEADIQSYPRMDDAIGYCFQQQGHAFYVLAFPTANKTWAFELKTKQWHELVWMDDSGGYNRHRGNCCAFAYGKNVIGDWQNGKFYSLEPDIYTDAGRPMMHLRTFPHMVKNGNRVTYWRFVADMEVGTPTSDGSLPQASLRWSDTRGASWNDPVLQSMGAPGAYDTSIQWRPLGQGRDRVFELSWSSDQKTALNGAFVDVEVNQS
jgi:hypothetical protein